MRASAVEPLMKTDSAAAMLICLNYDPERTRTAEAQMDAGHKSTSWAVTIALPRPLAAFSKPLPQTSHATHGRMWSSGEQPETGIYRPPRTAIPSWSGLLSDLIQD